MAQKTIYLDNAATTKLDERVLKAMLPYFKEKYGNASSSHGLGKISGIAIENAREIIAKSINAKPEEIVFTSGGTEANNLALKGLFFENLNSGKNHIITTKIEHDSILGVCKWLEKHGARVTYLDVDEKGFVSPRDIEKVIDKDTLLVSIIQGNNEIGTLQNIEEIGKICRRNNILLHLDACQSFTKINLNVTRQNIDLMTLNAHKIHGPKGIGVLFIKDGIKLNSLLHGGGHERGMRSGTENVPAIVGFAEAVKISSLKDADKIASLRDYTIRKIFRIPKTKLNGSLGNKRLCNNINISFHNIEGEAIASYLEEDKIYVSTGSACASHTLKKSHVLRAIGLNDLDINSSIRISISKFTTKKEIDYFIAKLKLAVKKLRQMSPFS